LTDSSRRQRRAAYWLGRSASTHLPRGQVAAPVQCAVARSPTAWRRGRGTTKTGRHPRLSTDIGPGSTSREGCLLCDPEFRIPPDRPPLHCWRARAPSQCKKTRFRSRISGRRPRSLAPRGASAVDIGLRSARPAG